LPRVNRSFSRTLAAMMACCLALLVMLIASTSDVAFASSPTPPPGVPTTTPLGQYRLHAEKARTRQPQQVNNGDPQNPNAGSGNLNRNAGTVQLHPFVHLIFWGSALQNSSVAAEMINEFSNINSTTYLAILNQYYSASGTHISNTMGMDYTYDTSAIPTTQYTCPYSGSTTVVTDAALRSEVQKTLNAPPTSTWNTAGTYFVYLPPSMIVQAYVDGKQDCSYPSGGFCAYHGYGTFAYAAMPYATVGCGGSASSDGDKIWITSTHEMAEAITDPNRDGSWTDSTGNEIGDKCNQITDTSPFNNGYQYVQELFSNTTSLCEDYGCRNANSSANCNGFDPTATDCVNTRYLQSGDPSYLKVYWMTGCQSNYASVSAPSGYLTTVIIAASSTSYSASWCNASSANSNTCWNSGGQHYEYCNASYVTCPRNTWGYMGQYTTAWYTDEIYAPVAAFQVRITTSAGGSYSSIWH
jgi:hypothetical protein